MAKRFEPRIITKRIDSSISSVINTTLARTYIGIEAKTGPYGLQQNVGSTKQLVQKFSTKSKPSKSDGVTLLHAGKFTQQFSADVLRVNQDKIHPGIDSVGNPLYFDKKYDLIKNLTKIKLTPAQRDISNQPLILVIDGTLFYNSNAVNDPSDSGKTFHEYVNGTRTERTGSRAQIITAWIGSKKLINQTDTDIFLDEVAEIIKLDSRFITYTNYLNRVFLMSGDPSVPYGTNLVDDLIQYDTNFSALNSLDYSRDLVKFINNGITATPVLEEGQDTGTVTLSFGNDKANLLFTRIDSSDAKNTQFIYNGTQYYPIGAVINKVTGVGTQLIRFKEDTYYRDSILSAIAAIYGEEIKIPSITMKHSVVIKAPAGKIFVKSNNDNTYVSEVLGELKDCIKLEILSYSEDVSSIDAWTDIDNYVTPGSATAGLNNYLRITFTGPVNKITLGAIKLVTLEIKSVTSGSSTSYEFGEYTLNAYKIGQINVANAIVTDLSDFTDLTIINAIIPNLVAATGLGEEVVMESVGQATSLNGHNDELVDYYRASNVEYLNISTPYMISWSGYSYVGTSVITKDTELANLSSTFYPQSQNMDLNSSNGINFIEINNIVYYNYSTPNLNDIRLSYYEVSSSKLTSYEFIEKLIPILYGKLDLALDNEGYLIIKGDYKEPESTYHNEDLSVDWTNISQTSEAKFAIVQRFTSDAALSQFSIEFDSDDSEIIIIRNVHNTESHKDKVSFNPDKVDGYGVNLYYDKFNRLDRAFHITELTEGEGVIREFESDLFGNEITPKKATIQDFIDALDILRDIGYMPSFIFDAGLSNIQYYKALSTFADEVSAMVPAAPPSGASYDEVTTWKSNLGYSTERFVLNKWQRDVCFGDIGFECSPAYYYLQLVLTNTNSVSREFQAIFGETQGRIEVSDPVTENDTKNQREELLDSNVNSIIRNEEGAFSYINKNYTDQSYESDFSEEQNVRISNKISHIATPYLKSYTIAKMNGPKLWTDITNDLTGQIQKQVIDNRGEDTLRSFRVVCNSTNNDANTRQVIVDVYGTYPHSVDEVLLYSRTEQIEG